MMESRCLDLDDHAATDPRTAGAKAAGLAAAKAAGLPVLPGVIVPVESSSDVTTVASSARSRGDVQARLAAMTVEPDAALVDEVRARVAAYPSPLIVRSSSPLEGNGMWSGAFSTFHGVARDEIGTAIRGCWGSAFAVNVLDRADRTGTSTARLGLAVLIQPELHPDFGGTARLAPNGTVSITATDGPLRPLMAGNIEGERATVALDGTVQSAKLDEALMKRVAELSRQVCKLLGHELIEWAAVDGEVTLLQTLRSSAAVTVGEEAVINPVLASPIARRIAALTQRYAGRLADTLVIPWAVTASTLPLPSGDRPYSNDPLEALAAARELAERMTTVLWGGSPRGAVVEADRVLRQLRGDDPGEALRSIEGRTIPDADAGQRILDHLVTVRDSLLERGSLDSEAAFWRCSYDQVRNLLRDQTVPGESRFGVDRWEPFVYGVVRAVGSSYEGIAAAPGAGVGRAHGVEPTGVHLSPLGRYVLVASEPSPTLGPLLWNAAGLVTRAGNTGAHLIEFAHSIGVPTVVGCDLPNLATAAPPAIAVDGERGVVSVAWLEER